MNIQSRQLISFKQGTLNNPYKSCSIKKKSSFSEKIIPAEIYQTESKDVFEKYELRSEGKILGDIEIENNPDSVFVMNLESYGRHKYSGIGTNLLQVAVEKSISSGQKSGIVTLNAEPLHKLQKHPQGFYKKLGFTTLPCSQNYISIFGIPMKLDVKKNPFWKQVLENKESIS